MHERPIALTEQTELEALRAEVAQLQTALDARVLIEQAKGVLAERYDLDVAEAFDLLRYSARSARAPIRDLAADVVARNGTPTAITVGLARTQRLRAAGQRERAEAGRMQSKLQRERARRIAEETRGLPPPSEAGPAGPER